jgi:hypothetical protein
MNSIHVAKTKGKGAFTAHTSLDRMKDAIGTRSHLADGYVLMRRYTPAAEIWVHLYHETGNATWLKKINSLAKKANMEGRHDVAEAVYLMLYSITKEQRCVNLALRAGRKAHPLPKN